MKYRKKPVVIEAFHYNGEPYESMGPNSACFPEWFHKAIHEKNVWFYFYETGATPTIIIKTLEGSMTANVGDWIIRGVKGELYPCKPDIFEATYEKVIDTNDHPRPPAAYRYE